MNKRPCAAGNGGQASGNPQVRSTLVWSPRNLRTQFPKWRNCLMHVFYTEYLLLLLSTAPVQSTSSFGPVLSLSVFCCCFLVIHSGPLCLSHHCRKLFCCPLCIYSFLSCLSTLYVVSSFESLATHFPLVLLLEKPPTPRVLFFFVFA